MVVSSELSNRPGPDAVQIREVWDWNATSEFNYIRQLLPDYPIVSMDTEFPGTVHRPPPPSSSPLDRYKALKANVDDLKLIQLGLTLANANGAMPLAVDRNGGTHPVIWQINFRDFDPERDLHSPDSIALLRRQGIDFDRHREDGVHLADLKGLMVASRLVCNPGVSWVTFHSAYDFAYLAKAITGRSLPRTLAEFDELRANLFGPQVYDLKHLIRFCKSGHSLHGGLERLAAVLRIDRAAGKAHQAASDSLLTWHAFVRMHQLNFLDEAAVQHAGVLYGLEEWQPQRYAVAH